MDNIEAKFEALEHRVAWLEKQLAKRTDPAHRNDWTRDQRRAIGAVCTAHNVTVAELVAPGRGPARVATVRMALYAVLSEELKMSDAQIARMLGRSRSTVTRGLERAFEDDKIDALYETAVAAMSDDQPW